MNKHAEFTDVDDESMTYRMDYAQYAQVGQVHCLGDEVRELRAKVQELEFKLEIEKGTVTYWCNQYCNLAGWVNRLLCLYGWAGDPLLSQEDALIRVRKDIEGLRRRIRALKGQTLELHKVANEANQYSLKMEDECNQLRELLQAIKADRDSRVADMGRYGADQWRRGNAGQEPQEFDEWKQGR